MKKMIFIVLLIALSVFSRNKVTQNWNGFIDTAGIVDTLFDDSIRYSDVFRLTDGEDIRVMCMVDDTSTTGFADDSVNFIYGYQTGTICMNSSGLRDTSWDDKMLVDTMKVGNFGSTTLGYIAANGTLTRSLGSIDTLSVSGFAVSNRWLVPEWDCLIRFWCEGLGYSGRS